MEVPPLAMLTKTNGMRLEPWQSHTIAIHQFDIQEGKIEWLVEHGFGLRC